MEKLPHDPTDTQLTGVGRRNFMRYLGTSAAAGVILSACHTELVDPTQQGSGRLGDTIDLGDIGYNDTTVLNFAYALEQLESAFYTQVMMTPYANMNGYERAVLTEMRDHEINHRELYRTLLGSAAIPNLTPNFSSVNFNNRTSVLLTARTFEAIGTSAYNGSGRLLKNPDNLALAGKIVSMEARHVAILSELLGPMTAYFAGNDIVSKDTGLGEARTPEEVLALARPYIQETINGKNARMA
ncbi:ferritin-like domain-containing protein [Spirosoma sp. BT702]|uniref:Ferritin-like domain-containing protein n=1 Tax=Spirosoma profusum TaxID=2771354 RepID=A0A926Y1P6_9BACT|nr:ferritin-like domain-containing protein [Spirosoma profusum]MBD2702437.1 ferritin-like domain-containing protein [Spirosoma profusum]